MVEILLVVFGATMRLLPHPANVAPIAAIGLFGGVYLPRRYALGLPLLALILSDMLIGFDSWKSRFTVYTAFLLVGGIGLLVRKRKNWLTILGGTLLGSLVFYLVTNFAYLYPLSMYPHTLSGVTQSYIAALPFFRNTVLGDLFYSGVFFGMYHVVQWATRHKEIRHSRIA